MPQYNFGAGRLYLIPNGADTRADQPVECGALQDIDVTFDGSAHVLTSARTWAVMASPGRRSIKAKAGAAQISPQFLAAALAGGSSPGARRVERGEPATITAGVVTAAMPGCIADLGVWDAASGRQFDRVGAPAAALQYATDDAGVWTFAPADEGMAVTLDYLRAGVDGVRVEMNNVPMGYTPRFAVVLSGSHGSNRMTLELASCVLGSLSLGAKLGDWLIPGLTFSAQARADGYVGRLSLDDDVPVSTIPPYWWEPFDEGLGPYATESGDRALFAIGSGPWGPTCTVGGQNDPVVASISRAIPGPLTVDAWSAKIRCTTLGTDDSALVSFYNGPALLFGFLLVREAAIDPTRGAYLFVGGLAYPMGVTAALGDWHRVDVSFNDTHVAWEFKNLTTSVLLAAGSAGRPAGPIAVDSFLISADSGGLTCATEIDDVAINYTPP